jgi:hemerythrin-like domain-containing protein
MRLMIGCARCRRRAPAPKARRLLKAAITATREHFRGEERSVFPLLEKVLQEETLTKLGQSWMLQRSPAASRA